MKQDKEMPVKIEMLKNMLDDLEGEPLPFNIVKKIIALDEEIYKTYDQSCVK